VVPEHASFSELRPNVRVELGSRWQLILRPRLALEVNKAWMGDTWQAEQTKTSAEFIEGYATWRVSEALLVSYGLQNFQWGPAESVGPSNRIFHDTRFARTPLSIFYGRWLARVNASLGRNVSTVFLLETHRNDSIPVFTAGEEFEPRGLLKLEFMRDNGTDSLGLVVGRGERSRTWIGEYGSLALTDGLSLFFDMAHARGSSAWYPFERDGALGFEQSRVDSDLVRTFAVVGGRYAFEVGPEVRAEYIYNEAGYTPAELELAVRAVREVAPVAPAVLGPYGAPGLELPGRSYLYFSVRFPDLGPRRRFALQPRYLLSAADGTGNALLNVEWNAADDCVFYLAAGAAHGPADGELTRSVRATILLASNFTW
jgi:hypothetical protein